MVTALVLQLIQCVVVLHQPKEDVENNQSGSDSEYEYDFDDEDTKKSRDVSDFIYLFMLKSLDSIKILTSSSPGKTAIYKLSSKTSLLTNTMALLWCQFLEQNILYSMIFYLFPFSPLFFFKMVLLIFMPFSGLFSFFKMRFRPVLLCNYLGGFHVIPSRTVLY